MLANKNHCFVTIGCLFRMRLPNIPEIKSACHGRGCHVPGLLTAGLSGYLSIGQ